MKERITNEEVKKRFENKQLILLDDYQPNKKLTSMDYDGYYYYFTLGRLNKFSHNVKSKVSKGNPYSLKNIQHYLNIYSIDAKAKSLKWDNKKPEIIFECKCGNEYIVPWQRIYGNSNVIYLCKDCKKKIPNCRKFDFDYVKSVLKTNDYLLLDNEYKGNNDNLTCINKDGYKVHVKFNEIVNNKNKKPYIFSTVFNSENYIYNVNNYFKINNINCKALRYYCSDKYNGRPVIDCKCECGNIFQTNIGAIRIGQYRCTKCTKSESRLEQKVEVWLKSKHIEYEFQKKFEECKDIRCLPFDFYLPKYNCCIEVDGEQHDELIPFGGTVNYDKLNKQQLHDTIKNNFCKDNNIKLIRIKQNQIERRHEEYKKILYNNLIKK